MTLDQFTTPASDYAVRVDNLFYLLSVICGLIVLLVTGLIVVFFALYYRGSSMPRGAVPERKSREIEIGWTAATLFAFLFFFWWAASDQLTALTPPKEALEIHVVAKQWMWRIQHPSGAREIDELHVPSNTNVRLVMTSQDVIHDLYLPALRLKQDILPDRYTYLWFNANKTGVFHFTCAEFCGTDHSVMAGRLVIAPPDEYARWTAAQPQGDDLAHQGEALFRSLGCSGCHSPGSTVHAPDLHGIYGHPVQTRRRKHGDGRRGLSARQHFAAGQTPRGGVSAAHAEFLRQCQREPNRTAHRLHQITDDGQDRGLRKGIAMTDTTLPFVPPLQGSRESYLEEGHTVASWLTTTDHKRIAILYALSITLFFFIGGIAIGLVRLELISPTGWFMSSDQYNRLFTLHGIIMVWFFLVPSIPATMGNFLLPMMIGAPDVAFPRLNLMSWYIYVAGAAFTIYVLLSGGVDTGWTFYPPFSSGYSHSNVIAAALGVFIVGFSSIATGVNFLATIHMLRAPGMTWLRLPLFVWSMYVVSLVMVLATPVLAMSLF